MALAGAALFAIVIATAILAELIAPYGSAQVDLGNVLSGPSSSHWLGTDGLGRDVLSRLMFGARPALVGIVEAVSAYVVVGLPLGLAAGYLGGWLDVVVSRCVDITLAIPSIVFVLVLLAVFQNNQHVAMVALGALSAPFLMRVVRGVTLEIREQLYVDAAKVSGVGTPSILFRHILPRLMGPVIVSVTLFAGGALLIEAGLGFLGLGPAPPSPSWGAMVAEGATVLERQSWLIVPSGGIIALTVLALGLMGDGIRDVVTERWSAASVAGTGGEQQAATVADRLALEPVDPDALLSVRDLTVAFDGEGGETAVLQHVSFDVMPGEVIGVVGESGSGKTMTALAILGLLPPGARATGGECWIDGANLINASRRRLAQVRGGRIAMISQEPMAALDPVFTIGSQLAEAVRHHQQVGRAVARARAIELLEMVGLDEPEVLARRYPFQLSGGMAQRVAIAGSLAGRPGLLIADEPTTALDVTTQAEILELLRGLRAETGMAIMVITHNWGVVADLCERALVMYAGQLVECADVEPLFREPLHPYTEGLLLSDPESADRANSLFAIPGAVPLPRDWPYGCRFAPRCRYATAECSEAPVDLVEPSRGRFSRCVHTDLLARERQGAR